MSAKKSIKFFRIILAVGFALVLIGINFLILFPGKNIQCFEQLIFSFLMILAAANVYISLITRKSILLYFGLNLFVFSVGGMIIKSSSLEIPFTKIWPIMMISFGITLIPSMHLKLKKVRTVFLIPAIVLCALGVVFMLFSYDIIKMSFAEFFAKFWPLLLVAAGVFLICSYFASQTLNKKLVEQNQNLDSEMSPTDFIFSGNVDE